MRLPLRKKLMTKTLLFAILASLTTLAVAAAPAPKSDPKKTHAPAAEPERMITYEELANFKNQRVIIHSTAGTTRAGLLTKYSQTQIDIAADGSGAQFTFLRDSIKTVAVPIAPESKPDDASAKKN